MDCQIWQQQLIDSVDSDIMDSLRIVSDAFLLYHILSLTRVQLDREADKDDSVEVTWGKTLGK